MYKLTNGQEIIRTTDGASLLPSENADWVAYQSWLAEGNTPQPADVVIVPIPTSLTMKQARLALLAAGHLDAVEAGVSAMPRSSQIAWEFAATVDRSDPLTQALAAALGLDSVALDALYVAGSAL